MAAGEYPIVWEWRSATTAGYYGERDLVQGSIVGAAWRWAEREQQQQMAALYGKALGLDANAVITTRKEKGMLERLKNLGHAEDGASTVEALVELAAYGRSLKAEFEVHEVPVPKWLETNLRLLSGRIKDAHRRQQEEKLRRVEKEIEELRSKEEKKAAKEKEAEELRRSLGLDARVKGE